MLDRQFLQLLEEIEHEDLKYLKYFKDIEKESVRELWLRGDLEFLLWPQQVPLWNALNSMPSNVRKYVNLCARQFGKSTFGVIRALSTAIKHRNVCILIMGPDIKQCKDIVRPKMRFLTKTAPEGLIVQMKAENRYHVYHDLDPKSVDYTEIILGGFNENSSSQRGKTVQEIIIEEVVDVHEDDYLESIRSDLGPAMSHSHGGKMIFNTTLPKYPGHPFISQTIPEAKLNNAISIYTIDDNIALTPEQKQLCIDDAGGLGSPECDREYYCKAGRDTKLVCLPDFDTNRDVGEFDLPQYWFPFVAIDWGGVRDKTAAFLYTYDYMLNLLLFIDERVFEPNTATSKIIPEVKEMEKHWCEIAGQPVKARWVDAPVNFVQTDLWADYKYKANIPLKLDWEATLNGLNNAFHRNQARVHSRCKFLVVSCESGILNKNRTDFERNEALGHMDGVAAAMYANRMIDKSNPWPAWIPPPVPTPLLPPEHHAIIGQAPPPTSQKVPVSKIAQPYQAPRGFGKHRR